MSDEPSTPSDPAVYRPHVNTQFSVDASPEAVPLTLASVTRQRPADDLVTTLYALDSRTVRYPDALSPAHFP
jgi:hypothetical protein